MWWESVQGIFNHVEVPKYDVWGGESPFSIFVSILCQNSAFSFGVLLAGQLRLKLRVLPGVFILRLVGVQFVLFLLVTRMMPLDLGFSVSCECANWRLG